MGGPPAHCRRGGLRELALTHGCHQDCARHGRVRTHQGNVLGDAVASVFLRGEVFAFVFVLAVSAASVLVRGDVVVVLDWATRLRFRSCAATHSQLWLCSASRSRLHSCSAG